jgi:hypothetical protein
MHSGELPGEALARFPLLRHHWPLVLKFQQQILDAASASLAGADLAALPSAAAGDALAALALMREMDGAALLRMWLDARGAAIVEQLRAGAAAAAGAGPQRAGELLAGLVGAVLGCVGTTGELFMAPGGGQASSGGGGSSSFAAGPSGCSGAGGAGNLLQVGRARGAGWEGGRRQ